MLTIDTPFHVTFSDSREKPVYACVGKCKKSWWISDLEDRSKSQCPQCAGELVEASENVHFKVLRSANRSLKLSDFEAFLALSYQEKQELKKIAASKIYIGHLSYVKHKFEKKALQEWC